MINFSMRLLACVVALIPSMAAWALRSSFTVGGLAMARLRWN